MEVASSAMITRLAKAAESRAKSALASSPIFGLRELRVEEVNDALLISGSVSSFYHKQLAQEIVRAVADGVEVINSIHVV